MSEYVFEKREYLKDSTPEEIEAIKSRVSLLEQNIILLREIPVVSSFTINLTFARMFELGSSFDKCVYLIDLSDTGAPNAETRRCINSQFQDILSNVKHVAFVSGKNFIINTVIRFVMYQTTLESFSISKSLDEALLKSKKVLNESN